MDIMAEEKKKKRVQKEEKVVKTRKKSNSKEVKEEKAVKPRKKVVKKRVSKEEIATAVPQNVPLKERLTEFVSSYKFLYTTFGILLVIVIILACFVFLKGNDNNSHKSNIVFSILEKNTKNSIHLDLEGLEGKEYILKVTNFRDDKLNKEGAEYTITITNETDVEIEVLKNNEGENLMTNQKQTVIKGEKLSTTEKDTVLYYIRITNSEGLIKGDQISIEVDS